MLLKMMLQDWEGIALLLLFGGSLVTVAMMVLLSDDVGLVRFVRKLFKK